MIIREDAIQHMADASTIEELRFHAGRANAVNDILDIIGVNENDEEAE